MPQMANITIKKHDGSTDLVFKARQPSAGDNSPARWSPDVSGARGSAPTFEVIAGRKGGSSPGRKVRTSSLVPVYRDVGGVDTFIDVARGETVFQFPASLTDAEINEAVAIHCNTTNSSLVKDQYREGYAAT